VGGAGGYVTPLGHYGGGGVVFLGELRSGISLCAIALWTSLSSMPPVPIPVGIPLNETAANG
jgi:hypothetical protein